MRLSKLTLLILLLFPMTSFVPVQEPKLKLEVVSDSIPKKIYPVANDGMIDLGPLIDVNKKMDNLLIKMQEQDTLQNKKD